MTATENTTNNPIQDHPFWRQHLEQWQQSALTQAAYCREHQLCQDKFSYYKRVLAVQTPNKPASGFVSVQVKPAVIADGLTLNFCNGVRLSGINEHNLAVVKQLAGILS
ncbi:IS66 family insertion sequence element accessory protein TnpA [Algibacillus agarilyticus]|uniref:IS66 family insertion sequence element accessory protein TnpA n=1 Tax=Algibacillus agarilyticus TaxID=2234133 RepID=UPI000DD08DAA|nr:hypothetical protein [Algibacillus agarilyticus]